MPGFLESLCDKYEPVRRTWEQALQITAEDCSQLSHWALQNGILSVVNKEAYLLSARIAYCTAQAHKGEKHYLLPDGRPNCGFFFGTEFTGRHLKQLGFWEWLTEQKLRGQTAGSNEQISRTRVETCVAYLHKLGPMQLRCCEEERDRKYGELDAIYDGRLLFARRDLNNILGAEAAKTRDPYSNTKGKDLSIDQMRRVQAVTAVSWMAAGLTRHIGQFMLLGLQALALHCWSHSRRTVFSRSVRMNGLSMDTAEDDSLEKVSGTCKDSLREAPLMIYRFVCTRDKGHGADTLIHGHQEQRYKADTFIRGRDPEVCLPGVLARYMRLRHLLLPVPLGPDDTLERFAAWALQPLFQTQISAQAHAQAHARTGSSGPPGTVPFMGTDKDVSRAATHLKNLYSAAGIEKTPGFCARRLRQGGTNAAMQRDLPPKVVAKRMGLINTATPRISSCHIN